METSLAVEFAIQRFIFSQAISVRSSQWVLRATVQDTVVQKHTAAPKFRALRTVAEVRSHLVGSLEE